ncbi:cytosolic carboxypeptidase 1-like isoform X1 [Macrosteles quadrilineatus]|uniref:cytosolic carboxypeptidase 1-like isoform X1 n=2 Tax=Macrosteles quadrilineatus TaxID=74068 RepID=UPI0023E184D3|nr:cytosolic carboxypeptidase 1-like isoform X1 [Macrosteles quadrilineatus]
MVPSKSKNGGGRIMSDESINEGLLEKLRVCAVKPGENIEQLRSVTARLHGRAASQDKNVREVTLERLRRKKPDLIALLLNLLENIRDQITAASIAGILHECISPKSGGSRGASLRRLVDLNATNIIVKMVNQCSSPSQTSCVPEPLLQELIFILGQLAQKDSKFSLKVRLLNSVKTFHYLLRIHYHNHNKMLVPVLIIVKTLARNANTTALLVKDGIATTMEKALVQIGFSPSIRLRLLLNVLNYLTKNNRFCAWMVRTGLVQMMVKMFERWERYDGKMRIKICNYTLLTLQHVCTTKAGRNAIRGCNGHSVLYKFCLWCPDEKMYDGLMTRVCSIVSMCMERRELPLASLQSPAQFQLPADTVVSDRELESDDSGGDESGDEGRDDDFDDRDLSTQNCGLPPTAQRDLADLKMYDEFWCEMGAQDSPPSSPLAADLPTTLLSSYVFASSAHICRFSDSDDVNLLMLSDDCTRCPQINSKSVTLSALRFIKPDATGRTVYCHVASRVRPVLPFVKVAYPDLVAAESVAYDEPLNTKDRRTCRAKLLTSVERGLRQENATKEVCYDLDQLLANPSSKVVRDLGNSDEQRVGTKEFNHSRLVFESRFESGNLRKAIQIGPREYDLILSPDVNSTEHCTWFYFEVSNMEAGAPYVFNIINCEKANSQFNYGMKPILFSVKEAMLGRGGWMRTGSDICYFRNAFPCGGKKRTYLSLTFTVKFPYNMDVCYLAYHYPYTYSQLLSKLWGWSQTVCRESVYLRAESLCQTLNFNETPVVTITAPSSYRNPIQDREVIFLTARVHPGECNSSWIMEGVLQYLLSDYLPVVRARDQYVFKVVPMLNPEGVINGCHRCGLTNEDLNRRWSNPSPVLHPVIYHTKGLIDYSVKVLKKVPYVFCDIHGHSRRKNVFLYGCSNQESWLYQDRAKLDQPLDYLVLPNIMQNYCAGFSLPLCKFGFERHKEATARVSVWREFGVKRSYTMECSFCGWDIGIYKGNHLNTSHLKEVGSSLCGAIASLREETSWRQQSAQNSSVDTTLSLGTEASQISLPEAGENSDSSSESNDEDEVS